MSSSGIAATSQEDNTSTNELVWHTVIKGDGTPIRILGPKDLLSLFPVQNPISHPAADNFQRTPRVTVPLQRGFGESLPSTASQGTTQPTQIFPNGGMGPLAQTAASTFSNIAADISSAATYSPRRVFDNSEGAYLGTAAAGTGRPPPVNFGGGESKFSNRPHDAGYTSPSWDAGQHQSWGRPGFSGGGQSPRAYRAIPRDVQSTYSTWGGSYTSEPTSPGPVSPPPGLPIPLSPQSPQPRHNPDFEKWCRNRLLEDKLNALTASAKTPLPFNHGTDKFPLPLPLSVQESTPVKESALIAAGTTGPTMPVMTGALPAGKAKGTATGTSDSTIGLPNEEDEGGEGEGEGEGGDDKKTRCKYFPTKRGCRRSDCNYIHSPKISDIKNSPKQDIAQSITTSSTSDTVNTNTTATGPRAIITRGTTGEKKIVQTNNSPLKPTAVPAKPDSPTSSPTKPTARLFAPITSQHAPTPTSSTLPSKPITILTRRSSAPVHTRTIPLTPQTPNRIPTPRIPTPPSSMPTIPNTNHGGISADMVSDLSRPKGIKEFCTYWIRTGKCDFFNQQGCAYSHDKDAYFAKYFPPKPAPPPPSTSPKEFERGHYPRRSDIIRHPVTLTIRTHSLPAPLLKSGPSPTKKGGKHSGGKNTGQAASPKKGKSGGGGPRKFVIRRATVELENGGRWVRGETVPGAVLSDADTDEELRTPSISPTKQPATRKQITTAKDMDGATGGKQPWKLAKKGGGGGQKSVGLAGSQYAIKCHKGMKGGRHYGGGGGAGQQSGVLLPGIESQTGMKVDLGGGSGKGSDADDLMAMDDGSVAGSVLELKLRK